jgi:D-glycero-D-manno-heptose 1,7-bisphosphate phosphatase
LTQAVFLDRDGIINAMVYQPEFGLIDSPANPDEFVLLPGVGEAVKQINQMGFLAIVISNQPGVAKGKFTLDLLEATKQKMYQELAAYDAHLDAVYYCLHHPDAAVPAYRVKCDCRKPRPGLLLQASEEWGIALQDSYFVGDGISDIVAGHYAGCKTFLVNSRKCYICDELARQQVEPDFIAKNLTDVVECIRLIEKQDVAFADPYRFRCQL